MVTVKLQIYRHIYNQGRNHTSERHGIDRWDRSNCRREYCSAMASPSCKVLTCWSCHHKGWGWSSNPFSPLVLLFHGEPPLHPSIYRAGFGRESQNYNTCHTQFLRNYWKWCFTLWQVALIALQWKLFLYSFSEVILY